MGSNTTLVLDRQRRIARTILVSLVVSVVVFVLFASGPNFGLSFAQQPPQIEFLNPSGSNFSEEISAKPDGSDSTYHLVAWVRQPAPANAAVEFRYLDPDSGQQVTIGPGTQSTVTDTYHTSWDLPESIPDEEELTLYAVLFSGSTEVDRDTETDPVMNNQDPDPLNPLDTTEPQGETVEIVYPIIGGGWGLFAPRDRATAGVLDVSMSDGVTFVRGVYTISTPGTEPNWVTCGTEERADAEDGVRCTLSSQHDASQVTAVGAIANDTQEDPILGLEYDDTFDDSGDAHRVAPYIQTPGTVVLDQTSDNNVTPGKCSRAFTATLTDQFNVPIANANMDAHARGPGEDTAFDNGTTASANKPPDRVHTTEAARVCSDDPPIAGGQQGKHVSTTEPDTKHIETALTAGTSDAGQFSVMLFSPTAGTTDFVVWADSDDDDAFCTAEKSAAGSVGWGGTAAPVPLGSDITICPSPTASSPNPGPSSPGPSPTPGPRGCTITGTADSETLEGTEEDDVICAGAGNDVIRGLGGDDTIFGDAGRDDIRGAGGDDEIHGGVGKDQIRGNDGNDEIDGDADNDVIVGAAGNDEIAGGAGTDTARGGSGNDRVEGQAGGDNLTGGPGRDTLVGGPGSDSLAGGPDRDRCTGNGGRDSFSGCENRDD